MCHLFREVQRRDRVIRLLLYLVKRVYDLEECQYRSREFKPLTHEQVGIGIRARIQVGFLEQRLRYFRKGESIEVGEFQPMQQAAVCRNPRIIICTAVSCSIRPMNAFLSTNRRLNFIMSCPKSYLSQLNATRVISRQMN